MDAPKTNLAPLSYAGLGVFVLLFITLGSLAQTVDLAFGIWASSLLGFGLPAILLARAVNLAPVTFLRLNRGPAPGLWPMIILVSVGNYVVASSMMGILGQALPESWHIIDATDVLGAESGWRLGLVIAGVSLAAPLGEEMAFRGLIQQPLTERWGPMRGLAFTAFAFTVLHIDPIGMLPRFELGLFFGWLVLRTGSLWPAIAAHAVNNGTASLLFLFARGAGLEGAVPEGAEEPGYTGLFIFMLMGLSVTIPAALRLHRATEGLPGTGPEWPVERLEADRELGLRRDGWEPVILLGLVLLSVALLVLLALKLSMDGGLPPTTAS